MIKRITLIMSLMTLGMLFMRNKYANMKILITPEQPLDEVVRELGRLGAEKCGFIGYGGFILSNGELYTWCSSKSVDILYNDHESTTLAELKEME